MEYLSGTKFECGAYCCTCGVSFEFDGMSWGDVSAADSCVYDGALDSLYIWDSLPEVGQAAEELYPYFGEPSDRQLTYREFFAMMDQAVILADESKLSQWQSVLPQAWRSDRMMSQIEGAEAILYLVLTLGDAVGVAGLYVCGRGSLASGNTLFDYERDANSMHYDQPLTARAAAAALTWLLDSVEESARGRMPVQTPASQTTGTLPWTEHCTWWAMTRTEGWTFSWSGSRRSARAVSCLSRGMDCLTLGLPGP